MDINETISKLTIEEKLRLLTGKDMWQTETIEHAGIPSITVSDGPHGVRKEYIAEDGSKQTHKAVSFPTASALAATWNTELVNKVGKALGKETAHLNVDILLGPGTNIKRTPLCGRNFEYFSEDPLLAGELAAAYINGVQSQNVGTSLKHYAGNNQEFDRNSTSSEIDERTLREIYLKPFEIAVKKAQPWTVMCAYNRLNGIYCSENKYLLSEMLREEFGFAGIVVSDWWAVHNRAKSLKATLELQMPHTDNSFDTLKTAYDNGEITEVEIDSALSRLLKTVFKATEARAKRPKEYNKAAQHQIAKEAALEAITLLKNEDDVLPINKNKVKNIAVIGQYAAYPQIQGGGSACVNPMQVDSALKEIQKLAGDDIKVTFSGGYGIWSSLPGVEMLSSSMEAASNADAAILFVGNNNIIEGEAHDRNYITLAPDMENLILKVASENPNTIVVIQAGSAIDMSAWIDKVKAVVFSWFAGEAAGSATADILFGTVNPSGKLAETFPLKIEDNSAYGTYPGNGYVSAYSEGVLVGYRYYDTYNKEVLFPFGYGLSYTTFEYSDLSISHENANYDEDITVKLKIKNTGNIHGKETVQLYISDKASRVTRPAKELKAFTKIDLAPNEEKEVIFILNKEAFEYYSLPLKDWHVESGIFQIQVGSSSRDIRLKRNLFVKGEVEFS